MNLTKEQILNYLLAIADELTDAHRLTDTDSTVEANSAVGTAQELVHELAENLHGKFDNVPMSNDEVEHLEMKAELHYGI